MKEYKNEGLQKIAHKFPEKDFTKIDDKFVVKVGLLCEILGLDIKFIQLEKGHSGYFDFEQKTIFVNKDYPASRNLFTVAHEIGHYILHNEGGDRYDDLEIYDPKKRTKETEANNFAGELLMPEYKFLEMFKKYDGDLYRISEVFGVSYHASSVRAFCLGLIDNI